MVSTMATSDSIGLAESQDLLAALREQATLFSRLEKCASQQRTLISDENPTPLLAVLADRQRLSVRLTEVSKRLQPVRQSWAAYRERMAPADRTEADRLLCESQECLRRVLISDEEDARLLNAKKQIVAGEMRSTHFGGQAVNAYGGPKSWTMVSTRFDEAT